MSKEPVPVGGIWVRRAFPHLGGKLEVLAEVDGQWRLLHEWNDDGVISHIFEPSGIRDAPPDPLEDTAAATTTAAAPARQGKGWTR